ncbi:MAG: hypothetical protein ACRC78_13150 [Planktothrix sp.]
MKGRTVNGKFYHPVKDREAFMNLILGMPVKPGTTVIPEDKPKSKVNIITESIVDKFSGITPVSSPTSDGSYEDRLSFELNVSDIVESVKEKKNKK